MRARTGKIARLPAGIRENLNRRLNNGERGWQLVDWLNALPEVQQVLAEYYGSRPITEDNLSEWRRGGFQDWLVWEKRRLRLEELSASMAPADLEQHARMLNARTQQRLATELAEELERISTLEDSAQRMKCLHLLSRELCRLQRSHVLGRQMRLLEAKAAKPFQAKSEPIGPFRTNDHGGGMVAPPPRPCEKSKTP